MDRNIHGKAEAAAVGRVFVALGGNLPSPRFGRPPAVFAAALEALAAEGVGVVRRSRWYRSPPWPPSDQPEFTNGVVELDRVPAPAALLALLHAVEARFGRSRGTPNAARILDLDLLAYGSVVALGEDGVWLPHPRLHQRAFVLKPLAELAPEWRHPLTGTAIATLIARLPAEQWAEPIEAEAPRGAV